MGTILLGTDGRVGGPVYPYANLTEAEAISSIGAWLQLPRYKLYCGTEDGDQYVWGPKTPDLCVSGVNVTLISSQYGNSSLQFSAEQLEEGKVVDLSDPSAYVISFPLHKYAVPNAFYEGAWFEFITPGDSEGSLAFLELPDRVINPFNATSESLRAYYGVPEGAIGSPRVSQGSTMFIGTLLSAVNAPAVDEYARLVELETSNLLMPSWAPPNNLTASLEDESTTNEMLETMLDAQSQQTFAPGASTYFIPNELPLEGLREALVSAGLAPDQVNSTLEAVNSINPTRDDLDSLQGLGVVEKNVTGEFFGAYLQAFADNVTASGAPQVLSLSWGSDVYRDLGVSFEVLEGVLRDLTLAGTTILVASGDDGASGSGQKCFPASDPLQVDTWPTMSPWVTVVGGTQFLADDDGKTQEVVCNSATGCGVTGGSGFASPDLPQELYARPAWQSSAVNRYLSENNPSTFAAFPKEDTPGYNPNGRAFPDVSLYASFFPILGAQNATLDVQPGTSLAAPLTAAMFTLANEALLDDGYETIGYANPMIYWMGENCTDAFNDITSGNTTTDMAGDTCLFGYPAAPGWDAATGMGSIRFEPFVACAKRYQDEVRSQGLELLPNGTFRGAPGSTGRGSMAQPGDGANAPSLSSVTCAVMAILACMMMFRK